MEQKIKFNINFELEEFTDGITWVPNEVEPNFSNGADAPETEKKLMVRLDKWLWAARFFKTRALARAAVEKGKVFYNGNKSKASREIFLGDKITICQGRYNKDIVIIGLSTRRRNTDEALALYKEVSVQRTDYEHAERSTYRARRPQAHAGTPFMPAPATITSPAKRVEVRGKQATSVRFLRRNQAKYSYLFETDDYMKVNED